MRGDKRYVVIQRQGKPVERITIDDEHMNLLDSSPTRQQNWKEETGTSHGGWLKNRVPKSRLDRCKCSFVSK